MPADIPADVPIDVVFASDASALGGASLSDPAVVIFPDENNWNDYGRQLFAFYSFYSKGHLSHRRALRFMFAERHSTATEIKTLLNNLGAVVRVEQAPQLFCSLLPEVDAYGDIVRQLGFDHAVSALRKMGDAVVVRMEGRDLPRLQLMDSEPFYISVLRQPGAFGALNRGSRMLRRAPPADVADSSQTFVAGVRMPNLRYPYVLRFDFEENVVGANRVNVLIGRNGAGKTQLIRNMILRLAEGFQQEGLQGQVRFNRAPRASRVLLFSSVSSDPYPRFVPPWHGIDYEYFSMTDARASGSDALLQSLMACRNEISPALKINGELTRRLHFLRKVLAPLQIWESLYLPLRQGSDEPDVLGHLVLRLEGARYFRFDQQVIERHSLRLYGEIDWTRTPVVINDAGVRHLSSGELAMFRFAAQAVSAIEQGSLLFFDEPETHLHPNFISDFMEILQTLLDGTHSIAIIATHSAYVVREVPRERVNVLAVEDKEMIVSAPRMQTFGASIDTISQFVFDDTSVGHSFQEKLTEWVRGPGRDLSLEQILERLGPDLNPESLSFIAEQKRRDSGDAT